MMKKLIVLAIFLLILTACNEKVDKIQQLSQHAQECCTDNGGRLNSNRTSCESTATFSQEYYNKCINGS